MDTNDPVAPRTNWLNKPLNSVLPRVTLEHLLITLILLAAIISRFYNLGLRVMSHDEVNHVVPGHSLFMGDGYAHDPVTHGPLQFHLLAASYFLLGDSDFSSRVPAAVLSIATVAFVLLAFKRYLGRTGALLAGLFFLISPYMLFYGRYTRNEAFIGLFGVIMLYSMLRYLELGKHSSLYLYTAVLALHFTAKETSFIYTAQMLIFLAILFIFDVVRKEWEKPTRRDAFVLTTMLALLLVGIALGASVMNPGQIESQAPVDEIAVVSSAPGIFHIIMLVSLALALIAFCAAAILLIRGLGWRIVKDIRSFDLLILTGTMVLPQLIAFPMSLAGWDPLDYSQPGLIRTGLFLLAAVIISSGIGVLWKPRLWLANMALFYAIFTIFFTTFFTNGQGFFTGIVGSLGYWLSQQDVNRGSQPWYYFAFLQVPMYEYLPAIGAVFALVLAFSKKLFTSLPFLSSREHIQEDTKTEDMQLTFPQADEIPENDESKTQKLPVLALLLSWSVLSLVAYSVAGEKMPWLTVHITLPMLLCAGFSFGYLIDSTPFKRLWNRKGWLAFLLLPVFIIGLGTLVGSLFGVEKPFQGKELAQLQVTSTFLFAIIMTVFTGWGVFKLFSSWKFNDILKTLLVTLMTILIVLTIRTSYQASFVNYDTGKEFLVYAHAARGPKDVYEQVDELSQRLTGGKDIKVAYIGDALYPYWWYFRNFPNKVWMKEDLTRDLLNYPVVISDDEQISKTRAILKEGYSETKYMRLVWPMQDYFNLTWNQVWTGIRDPQMRQAIFNIWLNKDYSLYAQIKNSNSLTLETWQPSGSIYLFIRKDIVAEIWRYGTLPAATDSMTVDPYEGKYITLSPDLFFGSEGSMDGQVLSPRGLAISPGGFIFLADSRNHRVQKFTLDGQFILSFGSFGSVDSGSQPGGFFNEPWGIAVGPDGSVFVADTWNHRIQKFDSNGKFLLMWGQPGTGETSFSFWGPRGIAVDQEGRVYVTDTGNSRVVVFDSDGQFVSQFGSKGIGPGEFDEPVGIAVDKDGLIYVADTWNQRIMVFEPLAPDTYQYLREWTVSAWDGQSVNNKPFLAVDINGNLYTTDPDAFRVLQFDTEGSLIQIWGEASSGIDGFSSPNGLAVQRDGKLWVSDAENNLVLRFTIPDVIMDKQPGALEFPAIPDGLTLNVEMGVLQDSLKNPIYMLNADGSEWIPLIPEGISSLLDGEILPKKDADGIWVLNDQNGVVLFTWDSVYRSWVAPAPTLPQQ